MKPVTSDPSIDPELARPVEAALAPYRGLLSQADLDEMRELLEDAMGSHPVALLLRRRLGPAAAPLASEEAPLDGASDEPAGKRRAGGDP